LKGKLKMESVLNKIVSRYSNYAANSQDVNLLDYLNDDSQKEHVVKIRSKAIKNERDLLKAYLPGITPSAICSPTRSAKNVIAHTGLICFDLDKLPPEMMAEIFKIVTNMPYVAYCGLSVSGTGYWGLIPISNKGKHGQHFEAMRLYFQSFGIDRPYFDPAVKDISRFRYQSFDKSAYFNHNAEVFSYIYEPPTMPKKACYANSTENNVFDDFNLNGDIETVLINNGWTYQPIHDKGTCKRYTRPGKENGISADYCMQRRVLYVFTDATEFEPSKGVNPVNVFCQLECNNDFKLCAKKLKALGYGKG
jgi:VirE N-terminal domain